MGKRKDIIDRPVGFYCKLTENEYDCLSYYRENLKVNMSDILREGIVLYELMSYHKDLKDLYDKYRKELEEENE